MFNMVANLPGGQAVRSPSAAANHPTVASNAPEREPASLDIKEQKTYWQKEKIQAFAGSRLLKAAGAFAGLLVLGSKLGMVDRLSGMVAQVGARQRQSPCVPLSGLRIIAMDGQEVAAARFNTTLHHERFDQHCALIRQIDPKAQTAGYRLMSGADLAKADDPPIAFYSMIDHTITINSDPLTMPGAKAEMLDTVRHEARHRDIHALNMEKNVRGPWLVQTDPCQSAMNPRACQRDVLMVLELINHIGKQRSLPEQSLIKLQEAANALPTDHLVIRIDSQSYALAKRSYPGLIMEQDVAQHGATPVKVMLPKRPGRRFSVFMSHLYQSAGLLIEGYDVKASKMAQVYGDHLRAAEYDATLVGYYGLKAAAAIIEAASYLPDPSLKV